MDTLNMNHKCWGCGNEMPKGDHAAYCPECRRIINDEMPMDVKEQKQPETRP